MQIWKDNILGVDIYQADAGTMSGSSYRLLGGFWHTAPAMPEPARLYLLLMMRAF